MSSTEVLEPIIFAKRYSIISLLKKRGNTNVFLAKDLKRENKKIILKLLTKNNKQAKSKLIQEAKITKKIKHPNVVKALDFGNFQNSTFFSTEYLEGFSLEELIKKNLFSFEQKIKLLHQLLLGLKAIHNKGITHGNIKPANILFNEEGIPKFIDFDIAKKKQF